MKLRFDQSAPYEVDELDAPFARPGGLELLARIYRPKGEAELPLAALLDVHGGAWSRNDRTSGAVHCRGLAAAGLLVVSLDFRQGSAHKHPAASADVAAGVRYVRAHARRLGVDPRRVGIVGSSSGGQLALLGVYFGVWGDVRWIDDGGIETDFDGMIQEDAVEDRPCMWFQAERDVADAENGQYAR